MPNLFSSFVVVDPKLSATALPVDETFWQELDQRYGTFAGHSLISAYCFTTDWPTWERHPEGDEIVCLLSGGADLLLHEAGGDRRVSLTEAGAFVIVPKGTWHTAKVSEQATMLFVTPGEGTENRQQPGD
ncbi:MAG: hypothetical protein RIA65_11230 [Woeseia sp.]